ncbi:hypothetical protein Tco_0996136 [Tanacetum coccineum]
MSLVRKRLTFLSLIRLRYRSFRSYYELDDNVKLVFLSDDDEGGCSLFASYPTKVRIGEKQIKEGQVPLLESTRDRVVSLAGVNEQGNQNDDVQVIGGASASNLPPKKSREDHGTSGASVSTSGKYVAAFQSLLERSTLAVEFGVTTVATVPFVTSSVSLTPDHEGVVVLIFSNAADVEVCFIVMSLVLDPLIMTMAIATTVVADTVVAGVTSALVLGVGTEPVHASIFTDFASVGTVGPDIAGPSQPAGTELSADTFYVSQDMDSKTLCLVDQLAPPMLFSQLRGMDYDQLFSEFNVGVVRQTCLNAEVRMQTEHIHREKKKLEGRCSRRTDLLKEKDAEIVATVEVAEVARASELDGLRERNLAFEGKKNTLKGQIATLESTARSKDTELASLNAQVAKLNDDLSSLQLSFGELSAKAATLDYELFKGQIEAVQDEVKVLSYCVSELDPDLMGAIGRAIDKGMQNGLEAGIDHGRVERSLADVSAYDPSTEANYDVSIADIMSLLHLEGPAAETPKASQLQPSYEQLMLPIHRTKDNVVIGETSLSFSLDVVRAHVQRIRGDASSHCLSLSEAMVPLIEPLSAENLVGEASTSRVPAAAATTTTLSIPVTAIIFSSIPPISVADYEVLDAEPQAEVSHSAKFVFEKEELDTTPDHTSAS